MGSTEFNVTLKQREVVGTALQLHEEWLPFSNLDLLLPPLDFGVFFCYNRPPKREENFSFASMVSTLKSALAQALVSYHALAGEVGLNSVGEAGVRCKSRGVDFMEAYADVDLQDVQLYNPDASIEGKLVPKKKEGVLCVQVTELRCGAIVVACTFDHRVTDAYSANMFLVAWAEIAQRKPISLLPSFQRSLLHPRWPACYDASIDNLYVPTSKLPAPTDPKLGADHLISRIYYTTAEDIEWLQSKASSNNYKRTKLESFSSYLWQIVAKSTGDEAKRCKIGIVVDGRMRLGNGEGDKRFSMATYFGNVLTIPWGEMSSNKLKNKPLSWVADKVHEYLESAVTKEHFLGLIDWVEAHRREPAVAKIYCDGSDDGPAFVVSSGQRFPVSRVDFGWGRPAFGSYHFPWGGETGYVMPMPSASGNGDWVVYMYLFRGQLEFLEAEAGDVFRPLTSDFLKFPTKE